jgi:putative hydrolase of the HAD superfamily
MGVGRPGQNITVLLLIDLDNTLIDRTTAFKSWASIRFGRLHGRSAVDWLVAADRDGYEPRERLATAIAERFGESPSRLLDELRAGMIEHLVFDPAVGQALRDLSAAALVPVIVTNGTVDQQEAKIRWTGLDRLVAGWTISEGAGVRKPDRRIFELAAASVGATLGDGGWMVGDHAEYDVGGGAAAGLRTAWVAYGRNWPEDLAFHPTVTGGDFPAVARELIRLRDLDDGGRPPL